MSGFAKSEPTINRSFCIFDKISVKSPSIFIDNIIPRAEFNSSTAPYDIILSCDFQTLVLSKSDVFPSSPVFVYILLTRMSGVNLLERIADERYGHLEEYQRYKRNTPVLVPSLFKDKT